MRNERLLLGLLVAVVLSVAGVAHSATYTATWAGGGDNLWNNATQWSPSARYPNNDQPVVGDLYNVTFGNTANTASLNQSVTINTLTFNGTNISNSGNALTVNGAMTWSNLSSNRPQLSGTGALNALSGITFNPVGNASASNPSLWNAWTVNLYGASTLGNLYGWYIRNMGTINVQSAATLDINGDSTDAIGYSGTVGTVNVKDGGTLKRSTNTSTSKVDNIVNNEAGGTVNVATGGLWLSQGGTQAGSFAVASGSLLQLSGTHTFNSGAAVSGAGNVKFTGPATFNSGATFAPGGTVTIDGAAVSFADATTLTGSLTALNNFQLNGTGDINVTGKFNWQLSAGGGGSSLNGAGVLNALGGMDITGYFARTSNKTINLYGNSTVDGTLGGGEHRIRNNATINIQSGATLDILGSAVVLGYETTPGTVNVLNGGTLKRSTAATTNELDSIVNNQAGGSVQVTSGGLWLHEGGTHAGSFTVASGSLLQLSGTHTFNSGAAVSGGGSVTFTGPATFNTGSSLSIGGNATLTGVVVSFANTTTILGDLTCGGNFQLNGTGDVSVSGRFYWNVPSSSNSLNGTGVLNALGGMSISGFFPRVNNKTINLYGSSVIDYSGYLGGGTGHWVANYGTINIQPGATLELRDPTSDYGIGGTGTINNQGTFFRALSGQRIVQNILNNTGTVRADAGGQLDFTGTVSQVSGTSLTGGTWYAKGGTINLPTGGSNIATINAGATAILENGGTINKLNAALTTVNGTFTVNGTSTFTDASGFAVGATGVLGGSGTVAANVTLNNGTVNLSGGTLGGTVTANGGTWSGTGTASGLTSVTAGSTYTVTGTQTGNVTLGSGATLAGGGTINGTVNAAGAIVAPGTSPGTLTVNGTLGLDSTSVLNFELGDSLVPGASDRISATTLNLDGTLNITGLSGFGLPAGAGFARYSLISYQSLGLDGGLLLGTTPGGGFNYVLGYTAAVGAGPGDVYLIIPEPASLALLGLAGLALLHRPRRGKIE